MPYGAIDGAVDAVVFDFDGVILESAAIKTSAFRDLFADRPDRVDEIVALHEAHGGISRFAKFQMIYRDILREPLDDSRARELGGRFEALVIDKVLNCAMVPGAKDLLERLSGDIPLFIVSGTPQAELLQIVLQRKLSEFFAGIFGSPRAKADIVTSEVKGRGFERAVLVGDAMTDYDAAQATGLGFVGRVASGQRSPFPSGTVVISDLTEFDGAVQRLGRIMNVQRGVAL